MTLPHRCAQNRSTDATDAATAQCAAPPHRGAKHSFGRENGRFLNSVKLVIFPPTCYTSDILHGGSTWEVGATADSLCCGAALESVTCKTKEKARVLKNLPK